MPAVVVTAEVEDTKTWEERFRSHASLFKEYTVRKPVRFAIGEGNRVTTCFEPEDLDTYMKSMESDATAEAMASWQLKFLILDGLVTLSHAHRELIKRGCERLSTRSSRGVQK